MAEQQPQQPQKQPSSFPEKNAPRTGIDQDNKRADQTKKDEGNKQNLPNEGSSQKQGDKQA